MAFQANAEVEVCAGGGRQSSLWRCNGQLEKADQGHTAVSLKCEL